jgi:putative addiction module killer protein
MLPKTRAYPKSAIKSESVSLGAGYRVYYEVVGKQVVLLLCGGDKGTQDADINRACEFWQGWQRRFDDEK